MNGPGPVCNPDGAATVQPAIQLYPDDFPARCVPNFQLEHSPVKSGMPRGAGALRACDLTDARFR